MSSYLELLSLPTVLFLCFVTRSSSAFGVLRATLTSALGLRLQFYVASERRTLCHGRFSVCYPKIIEPKRVFVNSVPDVDFFSAFGDAMVGNFAPASDVRTQSSAFFAVYKDCIRSSSDFSCRWGVSSAITSVC